MKLKEWFLNLKEKLGKKKKSVQVLFNVLVLVVSLWHVCFIFSKEGGLYEIELVSLHGLIKLFLLLGIVGIYAQRWGVIQQFTWLAAIVPYWMGIVWMRIGDLETFKVLGVKFRRKFTMGELKEAAFERFGSDPYFNIFSEKYKWPERAEFFDYSRDGLMGDIAEALRFYHEVYEFGETFSFFGYGADHYQHGLIALFFTGGFFLARMLLWTHTLFIGELDVSPELERDYYIQAACEVMIFLGSEVTYIEERSNELKRNKELDSMWFYKEGEGKDQK